MKLITHNMLQCNVKGCTTNNFPLDIKGGEVGKEETEFRPDFIRHMLPKLDWAALVSAAAQLGLKISDTIPENASEDEAFLRDLHTILLDVVVREGELTCRNCGRVYPITRGIPNMLLTENEV